MRRQFQRPGQMTRMIGRGTAEKATRAGGPTRAKTVERNIAGAQNSATRVRHWVSLGDVEGVRRPIRECRAAECRGECQGGGIRRRVIPVRQRPVGGTTEIRYVLTNDSFEIQNIHSVPGQEERGAMLALSP